jgi:hypothetical protein
MSGSVQETNVEHIEGADFCPCPVCDLRRRYLTAHWPSEEAEEVRQLELAVWRLTAKPGEQPPWPLRLARRRSRL